MSDNTQVQGRTLFTERDFEFTPKGASDGWGQPNDPSRVGDDPTRALYRWEMELHRQLAVGDVTKDAAAKAAKMAEGFEDPDVDEDDPVVSNPPAPSPPVVNTPQTGNQTPPAPAPGV